MLALAFLLFVAKAPAPPFAIHVEVQPSTMDAYQLLTRQTPETYTCSVVVYQIGTRLALAAPRPVVVLPGKSESRVTTNSGYTVEFTADISANADRAHTRVIVKHEDIVLNDQDSTVILVRAQPRNVPVK